MEIKEIILAVGEEDCHIHEGETYSMLLEGEATIEFNNQLINMEYNIPYTIPPNTVHTMKNIGNTTVKGSCGGPHR